MKRSSTSVALAAGALMASFVSVAEAQEFGQATLLSAPQWTVKLYTSPVTGDVTQAAYILYSYDGTTGKVAFQDHAHGFVHNKVWVDGQKVSWSNGDPETLAQYDVKSNLPEEYQTDAVIDELLAIVKLEAEPDGCSFKPEPSESINNVQFMGVNEDGNFVFSYFDGTDASEYVQDPSGKPLQIGDWHIGEVSYFVDPAVFDVHPSCFDDKSVTLKAIEYKVQQDGEPGDTPTPKQCVKKPANSSWFPSLAEVADAEFHNNAVKYDNNYVLWGGYGLPSSRLWGTTWCGYGNEYHVKARFKSRHCEHETNRERDKKAACKGKKGTSKEQEKFGCIGAPVLDNNEWKNDEFEKGEVSFRHWYPRHEWGCGNNCVKLQKKKKTDDHFNTFWYIMNSGAVPKSVADYRIQTDGIWRGRYSKDGPKVDFSHMELPNSGPNAQGLSRCRSVANYIDTDYQAWSSGLTSGSWKDWGTANTINEWTGQNVGAVHRHKDRAGEWGATGFNSDDWCRQHDWCPLGQGETKLTCACDAAAADLIGARPRNLHPFKGFPIKLFSDNEKAHACFNLRLECFYGGLKCKDFRIHWEKKDWNKYQPDNREGKHLWGPIARNDLGKETVCAKLRRKGEGIDGPYATTVPEIGNGICDCQYNNDLWGFDGGDCCKDTCTGSDCRKLQGQECAQPGCWTYRGDIKNKVGPAQVYNARLVDEACPGPEGNIPCWKKGGQKGIVPNNSWLIEEEEEEEPGALYEDQH